MVLDKIVAFGSEFVAFGFTATRQGGVVRLVRDGFARVIVSWIGGDKFVVAWESDEDEWACEFVVRAEVEQFVHMMVSGQV